MADNLPLALITLAQDQDLESLPSSAPQIYWTNASLSEGCSGAFQLMVQAELLQLTEVDSVRLIGQWSVDGRSWHDFYSYLDGELADSPGWTSTGTKVFLYGGLPQEYAPYVRFGIQVTGNETLSLQGQARMSASVTVLPWVMASTVTLATTATVPAPGTTPRALALPIANYKRGLFRVVVSAYANSGTSTCKLQVSPSSDPATADWIEIDDLGSFTGNGTLTSDPVDLIGQQARLLITAGTSVTFQVAATALLRG
jgi:hypothetical protein